MIDTHCHILSRVDDGSQSSETTLTMLMTACETGITDIIATPHCWPGVRYLNDHDSIDTAMNEALSLINEHNLPLNLYRGSELFMTDDTIAWIKSKRAISLADSDYYLIELPWSSPQSEAKIQTSFLSSILELNKKVVLAHPERYSVLTNDTKLAKKWRDMGCYFQINRTSLLDKDRWEYDAAWKLMNDGYVDIIATDAHHPKGSRIMRLDDIAVFLEASFGKEAIKRWFIDNPRKIINNELI